MAPPVVHPCRVNIAVTMRGASSLPGLAAGALHAKLTGCHCANANCILTAPADVQSGPEPSRLGCNVPKVLQSRTIVVLSEAAVLWVWVFVRVFKSASSGRQQRQVEDFQNEGLVSLCRGCISVLRLMQFSPPPPFFFFLPLSLP